MLRIDYSNFDTFVAKPATVLVIDDDKLVRSLLAFKLETSGHNCLAAEDCEAGLTLLHDERPDLVILETMAPDGSLEVLAAAARLGIPTIVVSARRDERDVMQALRLGAADYIPKPFRPGELMARIERVLRNHERSEAAAFAEVDLAPAELVAAQAMQSTNALVER